MSTTKDMAKAVEPDLPKTESAPRLSHCYAADLELAGRICEFLNGLLEHDRPAIAAMIANRIPCSRELADHPTVQVSAQHGGFHVGLLGLLNGLCGIHDDGNGPICAVFDHPDGDDVRNLLNLERFKLTHDGAA